MPNCSGSSHHYCPQQYICNGFVSVWVQYAYTAQHAWRSSPRAMVRASCYCHSSCSPVTSAPKHTQEGEYLGAVSTGSSRVSQQAILSRLFHRVGKDLCENTLGTVLTIFGAHQHELLGCKEWVAIYISLVVQVSCIKHSNAYGPNQFSPNGILAFTRGWEIDSDHKFVSWGE